MSRTCLNLLQNNLPSLTNNQKISMSLLQPIQYVDDDNDIQNLDISCGIPVNAQSLFNTNGNSMNVPRRLYWNDPSVTSDRNYIFTSCNTTNPMDANMIDPNAIYSMAADGYYNLFRDEIGTIISYCNQVNNYNADIIRLKNLINYEIETTNNINGWIDQTSASCKEIEKQWNNAQTNLNNQRPTFDSTFTNYKQHVDEYNKIYSQLKDKKTYKNIPLVEYTFSSWNGNKTIPNTPDYATKSVPSTSTPYVPPPPKPEGYRLQDTITGRFVNFDNNNNGILDNTGSYFTGELFDNLYNPDKVYARALKITSGNRAGNYFRHAGFVTHGDAYVSNNYDFSWVFFGGVNGIFQLYNYYGGGTYLDYNGTSVLITTNPNRRWRVVYG